MRRTTGPFFKNGVDLYIYDRGIRWFVNIFLFLLVVGYVIYLGVFINNYPVRHTYFKNPGMPGTLYSERYNFNWFMISFSIIGQGLLFAFVFYMLSFRENYGCHMLWFILYIIIFLVMIFVLIMLSIQYAECNGDDNPTNICNDLQWCCVHNTNPLNECGNDPCDPPKLESDLRPNAAFLGLYWTNAAVTILHFIFLVVLLVYWFTPAAVETVSPKKQEPELPKPENETIMSELTSSPPMESWNHQRTGLVRERNRR